MDHVFFFFFFFFSSYVLLRQKAILEWSLLKPPVQQSCPFFVSRKTTLPGSASLILSRSVL